MAMFSKIALPSDGTSFLFIVMVVFGLIIWKIFKLWGIPLKSDYYN
jgi:hypothetical protein